MEGRNEARRQKEMGTQGETETEPEITWEGTSKGTCRGRESEPRQTEPRRQETTAQGRDVEAHRHRETLATESTGERAGNKEIRGDRKTPGGRDRGAATSRSGGGWRGVSRVFTQAGQDLHGDQQVGGLRRFLRVHGLSQLHPRALIIHKRDLKITCMATDNLGIHVIVIMFTVTSSDQVPDAMVLQLDFSMLILLSRHSGARRGEVPCSGAQLASH